MDGHFIAFEGIDGCGKSTQIERALDALRRDGYNCIVTREPGGTAIAEKIRELILSPENEEMDDACELLLYLAARAQHVKEKILPALEHGSIVLCDRFELATMAYQGFGRGVPSDILDRINSFATGGVRPSLSFVFDVPVATAFQRMRKSGKAPDRLENNSEEFYQRVRNGYLQTAQVYPHRIVVLPGDDSVEELAKKVYKRLQSHIGSRPERDRANNPQICDN